MIFAMLSSRPALSKLTETVLAIEGEDREKARVLPFGIDSLDSQIAGGGLQLDALHEVAGENANWADDSAAILFISGIAARLEGCVLWALRSHDLFAPGLYQTGLAPERVIYAEARDDTELLAVMEEGLQHGGLAAVVGEAKRVSTTATRRLQLAARDGGTLALLLKSPARRGQDPFAMPSAALSRWKVAQVPSVPVPWGGLGPACWRLSCMRQRSGNPFDMIVEAPDETGRIALPAQLVDRPVTAQHEHARSAA